MSTNPAARRSWVSLILTGLALGMLITGVLSYLLPYSTTLSGIHTWFGLGFILAIILHISNNGRTLLSYLRRKGGKTQLLVSLVVSLVLLVGVVAYIPPFSSLIETGYNIRKIKGVEEGEYQTISTKAEATGQALTIELRAGPYYESEPQPLFLGLTYRSTPQVAFWIEDLAGNYIETLYVTEKLVSSNFRTTDITNSELQRRPESLPYWSHKRGIEDADGLMVPQTNNADLDGLTAATPLGHYDINTVSTAALQNYRVLMEINRSYDFNTYYSKDRFPEDPIYSGAGASGQPSVVYAATIKKKNAGSYIVMSPIGHGHHSGANGKLYEDISKLDTAMLLVERVLVGIPNTERLAQQ